MHRFQIGTDYSKLAKYAGLPLGIFLLLALAHWMAHSLIGAQIANGVGGTNASVSDRNGLQQAREICRSAARHFPAARACALDGAFPDRRANRQRRRWDQCIGFDARAFRAAFSEVAFPV